MPKFSSSNRAGAEEVYRAWGQYAALTLVKQSGLWGSNMLGHSTECHQQRVLFDTKGTSKANARCVYSTPELDTVRRPIATCQCGVWSGKKKVSYLLHCSDQKEKINGNVVASLLSVIWRRRSGLNVPVLKKLTSETGISRASLVWRSYQ